MYSLLSLNGNSAMVYSKCVCVCAFVQLSGLVLLLRAEQASEQMRTTVENKACGPAHSQKPQCCCTAPESAINLHQ